MLKSPNLTEFNQKQAFEHYVKYGFTVLDRLVHEYDIYHKITT